jgi:hypothetical protein
MYKIDEIIIILILIISFYYIIYKEREISGCSDFTIAKHCDDSKSIYLLNTKMNNNDDSATLLYRLTNILSHSEKAAVWRKCLLLSAICTLFVFITYKINNKLDNIYHYLLLLLLFTSILYFYHNYLDFHFFRNLKNNGVEIIDALKKKCKLN